mgnify:CR=1 FL=1
MDRQNILAEFGGRNIKWGICESVLIDGDRLICTPGGQAATIAALNSDPKRPLVNRAVSGTYPTGSSFKPITAAAALKNGLYKSGQRIDCPAAWNGYGIVQLNHETGNLGPIVLRTALPPPCTTAASTPARMLARN